MASTIDHATLEKLVEAGVVSGADVIGQPGGWGVIVKYGTTECALAAKRGAVRTFRKFETLVNYLKGLGIDQYNVNAANFDATALKTTRGRPDSAARMRNAFEAGTHVDWMQQKVAESLADPRPNLSHEQVMAGVQAVIDAKRKQHAGKA
ncbi:antitoxin PaaA2 family protein [Andreprevotia chitinilytica]|uniref:antitoxin PaaA2 family protein n=1 Tax=Andreprevotia chitinilytica TaxID=396808 RepID=UPI0005543952|nr:hypothetical protein [Andreprevotia chitinilytica]